MFEARWWKVASFFTPLLNAARWCQLLRDDRVERR